MEKAKKILITGSSGMLGYALCQKFSGGAYDLFGIDWLESSDARLPQGHFFKVDITDRDSVLENIIKISPGVVIHAAGFTDVDASQSDPDKAYDINSFGTQSVACACRMVQAFCFYLSTDYIFDGTKSSPYTESDLPGPLSVYGDSKLKGEIAVRENLTDYAIIRTSWLFGPKGDNFVDTILQMAQAGKKLSVVSDQIGSPTYTLDFAGAVRLLFERAADKGFAGDSGRVFHVTNSGSCSWYELAKKIIELKNMRDVKLEAITSLQLNRAAPRPKMSVLDNTCYFRFVGSKLRYWQEGLFDHINLINA